MMSLRWFSLFVSVVCLCASSLALDLPEARREAAWKQRRIIMNNDGNEIIRAATEVDRVPTPEEFLARRTSPLADSQVDAIFYCDGIFSCYTHRSNLTEPRDRVSYGRHDQSHLLADHGKDSLELIVEWGHTHGREVFWSMRMNDTHDSNLAYGDMMPQWKKDHPDLMMAPKQTRFSHGGRRWSAVDYGKKEVRDHVYAIFDDVISRYDVDGVEMDFFRHPVCFKPQMTGGKASTEQCEMMTALVRRIRARLDEKARRTGRPLLLAARVPDSVSYAKAIGIDLEKWASEGLVDILAGSGYFHLEPWENWAAFGKRHDIPVYACLSDSRLVNASRPEDKSDPNLWRGEALHAWEAGVNGIYTFNRFDPDDPLFRELGDPELLKTLPREYRRVSGSTGSWLKGGDKYLVPDPKP